jgi:PKD repeat protein
VNEQPEIISINATTFLVGTAGSFTIEADGYPAATFSADVALPDGISLSTAGVLSGTPTAAGVFTFTVTATNGIGTDASQIFTLTINQMPEITSGDAVTFAVGEAGSFMMTATGFPTPVLSLEGDLPDGVTFDAETGELSGTPVDGSGGVYTLTLTATNVAGPDTQTFTLTVNEAPVIVSDDAATFTVGSTGMFTVLADGHPESTFSATGVLPDGVTLGTDGVLSGTPADGSGGVYALTITATNGIAPDATQTFTLTVNEAPEVTSANATTFTVGQEGSFTVTGDGYPTVTYGVSGSLPTGVTFANGQLSGTPADGSGGVYELTITAANGIEPDATQTFTLTVYEAPEITSGSSTTFVSGEPNTFTVTATGFPAGTFDVSGALPSGVNLSSDGVLSGTPSVGTDGTYPVTITVVNAAGTATQAFTLTIVPPEVIAPDNITVSNDLDQAGAIVTYPDPTTVGNVGTVTCQLPSGSFFPLGTTTVTCSATSGLSDTFTITVLDTQRPSVSVPANISVYNTTGQAGAVVTYGAPMVTDNAPGVTWSCTPPSGTFFQLGTTTVTCKATDTAGNTTTATFTVTVVPTTQYLLIELRGDTVTLVTNPTAERALLATLDKVQQYVRAGNSLMAYMTMLQFVVQVERYADARSVTPTAAVQLLVQAQVLVRSLR